MPEFEYAARSSDGRLEKGKLIARDQSDLEQKLRQRELTLTSATVGRKHTTLGFFERFQGVPMVQKMFFTQYLHVMLRAGFSVSRALETLQQQSNNKHFKKIIEELRNDVDAGMSFSKSLSKHPKVFPEMFVNMVAAGESSGKLDEVLERLSMKMRKDHALIAKVKGALTYPIIILVAMVGVAILMMVFVIPKITEIFQESGAQLPLPTRILISVSRFMIENGLLLFIGLIVLAVVANRGFRTDRGKSFLHGLMLRLPVIAPIIIKVSLARFSRSLSSLLQTSIPIIDTFSIISRTLGNVHYRYALEEAAVKLKTGNPIAKTLSGYPRLFPPVTTQMIAVGEESGELDTIAGELATFYEDDVDQTMANLSSIIEPILMLFMGVGVAAMAVAVILPIYSLTQQIG